MSAPSVFAALLSRPEAAKDITMTTMAPTSGCISAMFRTTPAPKNPVVQIVGLNAVTMDGQPKRIKCVRPCASRPMETQS